MYLEDKKKFNDPKRWIRMHYNESPAFNSFDEIWGNVRSSYESDFKLLVYGKFPSEREVYDKFRELINILKR